MTTDRELSELVAQVARWALASGLRLVTAESCTGGWIAKAFTDLAGSSRWFECGFVTYSNAAKVRDLGVSARTLEEHGAVSEATVREMAAGALRVSGADISIAVSGVAGPDGGSVEKPVGTVWFCVGLGTTSGVGPVGGGADGRGGANEGGDAVSRRAGGGERSVDVGGGRLARGVPHLITDGQLFGGDREAVRRLSVEHALKLVLRLDEPGGERTSKRS